MRQGTNRTSEDSSSNFSRYSDDICAFDLKGAAEKERNMQVAVSNLRTLVGKILAPSTSICARRTF